MKKIKKIYIIDKPANFTSFDMVLLVKKKINIKCIGHAGTLDPFASGLIILLINRNTKLMNFLIVCSKVYEAEIRLGVSTNTDDCTGMVSSISAPENIRTTDFNKVLQSFLSANAQLPPIYSAILKNGKRSYARFEGELANTHLRFGIVFKISIISYSPLRIIFCVSDGMYIRAIIRDLGIRLGVFAHLRNLRRVVVGNYSIAGYSSSNSVYTALFRFNKIKFSVHSLFSHQVLYLPYNIYASHFNYKVLHLFSTHKGRLLIIKTLF